MPLRALGTEIDLSTIVQLPIPNLMRIGRTIQGAVQAIDHFGNLITNIPGAEVAGRSWSVRVENVTHPSKTTYSEGNPREILALVGSHGWVEIAANRASAQAVLNLEWGGVVSILMGED